MSRRLTPFLLLLPGRRLAGRLLRRADGRHAADLAPGGNLRHRLSAHLELRDLSRGHRPVLGALRPVRGLCARGNPDHARHRLSGGLHDRLPRRATEERAAAGGRASVLRQLRHPNAELADGPVRQRHGVRDAQGHRPAAPGLPFPCHAGVGDLRTDVQLPPVHDPAPLRGDREDRPAADRGGDRPVREPERRRSGA